VETVPGDTDEREQNTGSGSRNSDGNVPNANWNDGKFRVNWNYLDNRDPNLRSRQEVSHKKEHHRHCCL